MWIRRAVRRLFVVGATILLAAFLGAALVWLAPGLTVDERQLDPRLNQDSIQALRQSRAGEQNLLRFYVQYLAGILRGDLGVSRSLSRPVLELFSERIPVTSRSVGLGLAGAWALALALALPAAVCRVPIYDLVTSFLGGIFVCIPTAVLALLFLFLDGPVPLAIALAVFPRLFRYARNVLLESSRRPHVLTAWAKGLGAARILWWHVAPSAVPQLLALAGASVSMGFGAAIPIEVVCDSPGIGQLAWQAALGRDLPLLVNVTLLVTVTTLLANWASDLAATVTTR